MMKLFKNMKKVLGDQVWDFTVADSFSPYTSGLSIVAPSGYNLADVKGAQSFWFSQNNTTVGPSLVWNGQPVLNPGEYPYLAIDLPYHLNQLFALTASLSQAANWVNTGNGNMLGSPFSAPSIYSYGNSSPENVRILRQKCISFMTMQNLAVNPVTITEYRVSRRRDDIRSSTSTAGWQNGVEFDLIQGSTIQSRLVETSAPYSPSNLPVFGIVTNEQSFMANGQAAMAPYGYTPFLNHGFCSFWKVHKVQSRKLNTGDIWKLSYSAKKPRLISAQSLFQNPHDVGAKGAEVGMFMHQKGRKFSVFKVEADPISNLNNTLGNGTSPFYLIGGNIQIGITAGTKYHFQIFQVDPSTAQMQQYIAWSKSANFSEAVPKPIVITNPMSVVDSSSTGSYQRHYPASVDQYMPAPDQIMYGVT